MTDLTPEAAKLEAANARIAELEAALKVRPLVWANEGFDIEGEWSSEATTRIGTYWVIHEESGCYVFFNRRKILGFSMLWDRDDAKAAAQLDYESRIRAALEGSK